MPTLLILAAGSGTRYGGLKQLDALGPHGETIMDYSIHDALKAGFGKVALVIRQEFQKDFEEKILLRWRGKIKIDFAFQEPNPAFDGIETAKREKPWGPVHAMLCAQQIIREPFALINADDFYGHSAFRQMGNFLREFCASGHYALLGYILRNTLSEHGSVSRGICETDESGFLAQVREMKEVHRERKQIVGLFNGEKKNLKPESLASMNCWGFHPDFFSEAEKIFMEFVHRNANNPAAELVIPDVADVLVKSGKMRVSVLPCNEKWFGVTHREDRQHVIAQLKQLGET